jgi:PadR family transcriptional regulator PadR
LWIFLDSLVDHVYYMTMTHSGRKQILIVKNEEGQCCSHEPGSRIRGFIQPWILLLLSERPSHGYELLERLHSGSPETPADTALLYRTLRQMESDGLVRSAWETGGNGPARRLYEMTSEGVSCLHGWAANLRRTRDRLEEFMVVYEKRFPGAASRSGVDGGHS